MKYNFNFEHLDKNHAPGANEAFLKVREARAILTNPVKRAVYNFLLRIREANIPEPDPQPNPPDKDVFWAGDVPKNRSRNKRNNRQRTDEVRMVNIGKKDILLYSMQNLIFCL